MTTTTFGKPDARGRVLASSLTPHITLTEADHERLCRYVERNGHDLERLEGELARARVVAASALPVDVVTMGSRIVYEDTASGVRRTIAIVFPENADAAEGRVSVLAPIGSALIGLRVGDEIDWELPNDRHTRLRVVALEHQVREPGLRVIGSRGGACPAPAPEPEPEPEPKR